MIAYFCYCCRSLDFVNLMSYDLYEHNTTITQHHAALYAISDHTGYQATLNVVCIQ